MSHGQGGPETKGVTVATLGVVDLVPEIEGMAGRQLRMRQITIEPGGVFGPIHDHIDRPGIVYVLQGTITDHRDGIATDYGPWGRLARGQDDQALAGEQGCRPGGGGLGGHRQTRVVARPTTLAPAGSQGRRARFVLRTRAGRP